MESKQGSTLLWTMQSLVVWEFTTSNWIGSLDARVRDCFASPHLRNFQFFLFALEFLSDFFILCILSHPFVKQS